ncbi:MAG: DUF3500 domain-containing protein [Ginsengibacter sp.]
MRIYVLLVFLVIGFSSASQSQKNMQAAASNFLSTLTTEQTAKAQFALDSEERYHWRFVPVNDRQGITVNELNTTQRDAAMKLLHTVLSDTGYNKVTSIMQLENVLKNIENRPADDHYRDPGKYFFTIFGTPAPGNIWGWRLEGHHIAFNFSSEDNKLVSGTPSFLGSNPAIILSGPEKGKQILKNETELGFALLHSLDPEQMKLTLMATEAPAEIITSNDRKAMITDPRGILYNGLNIEQQKMFLELLSVYIHRYTASFAVSMMQEIEDAGLKNLRFTWAGSLQPGKAHYYRIQGPTLIIEYDNTQNNANHVHTVIRDLKHDFGGDELLEHYKRFTHQ